MLATVKGYYNGSQIVLDTPVQLQIFIILHIKKLEIKIE